DHRVPRPRFPEQESKEQDDGEAEEDGDSERHRAEANREDIGPAPGRALGDSDEEGAESPAKESPSDDIERHVAAYLGLVQDERDDERGRHGDRDYRVIRPLPPERLRDERPDREAERRSYGERGGENPLRDAEPLRWELLADDGERERKD